MHLAIAVLLTESYFIFSLFTKIVKVHNFYERTTGIDNLSNGVRMGNKVHPLAPFPDAGMVTVSWHINC